MRLPQHLVPYLSTTPQPIALSLGRVVRSSSRPERLEACLKAAEMLTRYLAVVSLASAAATRDEEADLPAVPGFEGNLAFGTFELAIRQALAVPWDHPLRASVRRAMQSTKKQTAISGVRIERFVQLRNELGHAITHVDDLRAAALFDEYDPIGALIDCIEDLSSVLNCPPLVVVRQDHRRLRLTAQVLFFLGEGDPIPIDIDLADAIFDWEKPYLCTHAGLIPLTPGLTLRARPDGRRGLYLIDGVEEGAIRYKGAFDNDVVRVIGADKELRRWLSGVSGEGPTPSDPLLEPITCSDGRSLFAFLRNEGGAFGEVAPDPVLQGERHVWTVSRFEQAINGVGLGSAFRDVVYAMAERGCRAEPSPQGVRLIDADGGRVLVLIELQPGPVLLLTVQLAAFPSAGEGTESFAVRPAHTVDEIVRHLAELMSGGEA